ncbi:ssDNA-binding protein, mitochondrial [Savitreella phatthalungensis]
MFSRVTRSSSARVCARAFSTTQKVNDFATCQLFGRISQPQKFSSERTGTQGVKYGVAVTRRSQAGSGETTWYNVVSYDASQIERLAGDELDPSRSIKGAKVLVNAQIDLKKAANGSIDNLTLKQVSLHVLARPQNRDGLANQSQRDSARDDYDHQSKALEDSFSG